LKAAASLSSKTHEVGAGVSYLPNSAIGALPLKLGCSRFELVFPTWDGKLQAAKLPHVTFHGLRHTHITHLLRSGVPVHVVSAGAGHASPTTTLNIYAHLLPGQQESAAAIMDAALKAALEVRKQK
jgi:integrase